jgi:hypothetical protein
MDLLDGCGHNRSPFRLQDSIPFYFSRQKKEALVGISISVKDSMLKNSYDSGASGVAGQHPRHPSSSLHENRDTRIALKFFCGFI